jgi:hypothetical protein
MAYCDLTLEELRILLMNHVCQVSSIIEDHVQWLAIGKAFDGLFDAPVILLLALAFPCEDGGPGRSDATYRKVTIRSQQ